MIYMKKLSIFIAAISLFAVICNVYALPDKKNSISSGFGEKVVAVKDNKSATKIIKEIITRHQDDTVYCLATEKKFGWQTPVGIITKEDAGNRAFSIRLSNRNKAGNFCNLEVLGKDLNPIAGGMSLTISKFLPDSVTNSSDYLQSCSNIHRLTEIPDYSGKHILQERFYDVDDNLIGYVLFNYTDNYYVVKDSYFGPNGLPIKIGESETTPYGVQLNSIYDENGNDSILFLTSGNKVVANKDGGYYWQNIHTRNEKGDSIEIIRSLDINSNPMIDRYGNCGYLNIVNKDSTYAIFIDDKDNPMILPETSYDKSCINVSAILYRFSPINHYLTATEYFDINGEPCENILGTHKVVIAYDSIIGKEIMKQGYNLQGLSSPIDENDVAKYTVKWDSLGNVIEYHQFDKNNKPISKNGNSSYYNVYDPTTKRLLLQHGYIYIDSLQNEVTDYYLKYTSYMDSLHYSDGTSTLVKYDNLGRVTSRHFFDKFGNPSKDNYCAVDSTQYIDGDGINKSINREFRSDGSLQSEIITDSILFIKTFYSYNDDGVITDSYQQRYTMDWSIIGQTDCSEFGLPSRAGGNSDVRYLYANIGRTLDGRINTFSIVDEFNEPDYLVHADGEIYAYMGQNEPRYGSRILYDEFGVEIAKSDFQNLRNKLPKVMSIEVVDSNAINHGLRDNDIILNYGNYKVNLLDSISENQFHVDWTIRNVLDANTLKDMVVFRIIDAENGIFGLDTIRNLCGTPASLGFIPHTRFLTKRQTERILSCLPYTQIQQPRLNDKNNYIVISFPQTYRSRRNTQYMEDVTDASILLGGYDKSRDLKYNYKDKENTEVIHKMMSRFNNANSLMLPQVSFYLTTDGNLIKEFPFSYLNTGLYLLGGYINNVDFESLKNLYIKTDSILNKTQSSIVKINPKKIKGNWEFHNTDSVIYPVHGNIQFLDDGECNGFMTSYCYIPESTIQEKYGSPIFKICKSFSGTWRNNDSLISIRCYKEARESIECVDILNPKANISDILTYFNEDYSKYPSYYDKKFINYCGINNEFFIESIAKEKITINDGCGNVSELIKCNNSSKSKIYSKRAILSSGIIGVWSHDESSMIMTMRFMENRKLYCSMISILPMSETHNEIGAYFSLGIYGEYSVDNNRILLSVDENTLTTDFIYYKGEINEEELNSKLASYEDNFENVKRNFLKFLVDSKLSTEDINNHILRNEDTSLGRIGDNFDVVIGEITEPEGYLVDKGLTGKFIILEWCNWNCTMDVNAFSEEFEKQKDNPKTITLMALGVDENGNDAFGTPFTLHCPSDKLGLHIASQSVSSLYYIRAIKSRYKMIQ